MTSLQLALACCGAPLAAFFVALVFFRKVHGVAAAIVIAGGAVSAISSVMLLLGGAGQADPASLQTVWFTIGRTPLEFGFLLDGRSLLMGAIVGVIAFCIQIYSLGYMADDPGKGRFFAFLGLFEWAMLSFVYAPNLLQGFIFWELVGLASFLLIGFWYHKPSAVAAAKKAFLMTRVGDVGLFIGLVLLFQTTGTLDVLTIIGRFAGEGAPEGLDVGRIELIAGLLFVGIVGKSAQFPLHTWLPDAMEGPTPVSALLHSATMVAAGVFLFARFHELFMDAPMVLTWALGIATFTAILASTMAMVAWDMKKVLAYSSISQLGFMLMGLAAGSLYAGVFHLTTHAVFKALLFLCAGAFIHDVGSNDMVAIGRAGGRKNKVAVIGLLAGGLALAGVPPFGGFWSKDLVLHALHGHTVLVAGAFLASFLTAYYTGRMIFLVTMPNPDSAATVVEEPPVPVGDGHESHGPAWPMNLPVLFLAGGACVVGFGGGWISELLGLGAAPQLTIADYAPAVGVALAGLGLAWFEFGRKGASQTGFISKVPVLKDLFEKRWHVDTVYNATFVAGTVGAARGIYVAETEGFDGTGDAIGRHTIEAGATATRLQNGRLQTYIGLAVVFLAAVIIWMGV